MGDNVPLRIYSVQRLSQSLGAISDELNLPGEDDVDSNTPTNTQAPLIETTQQEQQQPQSGKSKGKCSCRDADFSSPAREVETSQFLAVPTQESLIDERDLGDSTLKMLHRMEARMIAAERANAEKDAEIRSLTGRVLDLTKQLTAMMQQLFQDSPVEQAGGEGTGRNRRLMGPPPVPAPTPGQVRAQGLQPPAARSMHQQLQEGQQTHPGELMHPEAQQAPPAHSRTRSVAQQPPLMRSEMCQVPQQPHHQQQQQQQQQPQQPAAPAKNKAWGKLPKVSYTGVTAVDCAAIADQIVGI
ncbi:hypothetical protein BC830DRAFT_1158077 [Chytriomyces sp. MP71]|nr:hypothetical protein BC830DRAFT_1158077 [Chytriomyces sp. MP71]